MKERNENLQMTFSIACAKIPKTLQLEILKGIFGISHAKFGVQKPKQTK